jgi:hypothetical protein
MAVYNNIIVRGLIYNGGETELCPRFYQVYECPDSAVPLSLIVPFGSSKLLLLGDKVRHVEYAEPFTLVGFIPITLAMGPLLYGRDVADCDRHFGFWMSSAIVAVEGKHTHQNQKLKKKGRV